MSSTTNAGPTHARNAQRYASGYRRAEQMLAGHSRDQLRGYKRTLKARLLRAEFGSPTYAVALGAWTYINDRLNTGPGRRTTRARRRIARRYPVRGSKW
ncbi:hypothetical protein ACQPXM_41220 (plasmid) [Kribbella sp. CA-253562]|uniref:hypothetical protein n=1 Tax=Kribbella sp. CA-253562 TaxID=3239942 RepID=UPI003D8A888A